MPFANEHAARLHDPEHFKPGTFKRTHGGKINVKGEPVITVPSTIDIIWGQLKAQDTGVAPQALRFPVKNWTESEAKKWLKDKGIKPMEFVPASGDKNASLGAAFLGSLASIPALKGIFKK